MSLKIVCKTDVEHIITSCIPQGTLLNTPFGFTINAVFLSGDFIKKHMEPQKELLFTVPPFCNIYNVSSLTC